jgi:hypothetical protein
MSLAATLALQVYVDPLSDDDLLLIANTMFPDLAAATWPLPGPNGTTTATPLLQLMIAFSQALHHDVERGSVGRAGECAMACRVTEVYSRLRVTCTHRSFPSGFLAL